MGDRTSNKMENLSLQSNPRIPRDLLHRFPVATAAAGVSRCSDLNSEEVELNLGLSLGGRFGVDKSNSKLIRSSSIAAILPVVKDDDVLGTGIDNSGRGYSGLIRTSSLPVETEDEWRKRKELQSLRRLAAKRRRSEKQRSLTKGERDDYVAAMSRVGSSPGPLFGSNKWHHYSGGVNEGSSGGGGETRSLIQESSSGSNPPGGLVNRESSSKRDTGKEIGSSCSMEGMPCVFTQGDGPNGRVVEGILYKYGKGEQVKIMCICHGSFLSPAEFVKHAGGTDFLHPLKHIVVKPSSSSFS